MTRRLPVLHRAPPFLVLLALVAALGLGACGRRGQPEPPADPAAAPAQPKRAAATTTGRRNEGAPASGGALATSPGSATQLSPDDDSDQEDATFGVSPQPAPRTSRRRQPYQVPKEPFILDPLL